MMKTKQFMKSLFSMLLAVCIITGYVVLPAEAEETDFHYVSLGASNTNGYGLRGYILEEELNAMLSGQVSKDEVNVYGYERIPEGGYPDLIRDYYVDKYGADNVIANQLAISSMRVEELRILIDDSYNGDEYSAWRFTGSDGWFVSAEEGGIPALRNAYQESIKNADLVTMDIGWNNFGVYVCNQLVDYMSNGTLKWNTNINDIFDTEAEDAAAQEAKEIIGSYIVQNVGEGDMADVLTDIFAYAILGYIHNFDICMEKIYELNPDVDVVVLGIQNLLDGAVVDLNGNEIPLGNIFGNFVNMANYYISALSPYQTSYQYVKAGNNEHVTIFLDQLKEYEAYDGTPADLTQNGKALVNEIDQNVRDCFDYYDNDLFIQTRVDYMAAALVEEEYGSMLSAIGYESAEALVADGKANKLDSLQSMFDTMYYPALFAAYDTLAELVQVVANYESVDANGLLGGSIDIGAEENALKTALEAEIQENALAAANETEYIIDIDTLLPDAEAKIVAAMYIRYYMGNSFFAHPNLDGHAEIRNAVVNVIENPKSEKDQELKDELIQSMKTIQVSLCEAAGHDYQCTFEWAEDGSACEAVFACNICKENIIVECEITAEEDETAIVYTAVCELDGEEYTDSKTVNKTENPEQNGFPDVEEDAWYYNAVQWAVENDVTAGYEDGTFRPEASSTRAHVVMFLWNKMGKPAPTATENPFPDVAEDAWYYNAVLWAAEAGITAGYEDGTFRPEDICTRAHVVKFLWNLAGEPAPETTDNPFSDVDEGKWYYDAVLWAAEAGITVGYEDGTFKPEKECTRAEIVQLLYAAYK